MPAAAVTKLDNNIHEETTRPAAHPSEYGRPDPKFRVVTRKPLPPQRRRRSNPVRNAMILTAFPAACLLVYVLCWTMAIRGGMMVEQLQQDINRLRVEQADARAQKQALQSPGNILVRAEKMGMRPASGNKRYLRVAADRSAVKAQP